MKKTPLYILFFFHSHVHAQINPAPQGQKEIISFHYDQNGNRIKREIVLVNCEDIVNNEKSKKVISENLIPHTSSTVTPNPTKDIVVFKSGLNQFSKEATIAILDALGKKIQDLPLKKQETTLSFAQWPDGIYYIHIYYNSNTQESFKVIKY